MSGIKEFKRFIEKQRPSKVTFWSESQDDYDLEDPCEFKLTFKSIQVSDQVGVVLLSNEDSSMCLYRIRDVEIDTESCVIGTIIKFHCGIFSDPCLDCSYIMLAS